ncbi:MAG: DUF4159 domain-containing protein [Myxococcales bacterium]|nr:DUF4159 domain-containing protein [Myxococcales bacterium]
MAASSSPPAPLRDAEGGASRLGRRLLLASVGGALLALPKRAPAFGEEGAFNPRIVLTGGSTWEGVRATAPGRWSDEVVRRTSAPGRLRPTIVQADEPQLLAEPFAVWGGSSEVAALTSREVSGLRQFFAMGGVLFVDDFEPEAGAFGKSARREIARVLPEQAPIPIGPENVVFRSFYLMKRAVGRAEGPAQLDAIVRAGAVQVLFSSHDVLGALARDAGGTNSLEVSGGDRQREQAIRLAVNVALYVLCSNYKDDQVHAEHIMRRRGNTK